MKLLKRFTFVALILVSNAYADVKLTKDMALSINTEMGEAFKTNDFSVIEKYVYPGTRIIVDLDPAVDKGQKEIPYEKYMALTKMAMSSMKNVQIDDEVISVNVDETQNQVTVKAKTSAISEIMGMKIKDVSINITTYGVVDDKVKIIHVEDQIISSGVVKD